MAQWLGIGFIHGVMNTDNMSIAGETIDFGPCAFMDDYHSMRVFSSIDETGRYAYARQPDIAHWNLACLARALLPLLGADEETAIVEGQAAVDEFPERFGKAWQEVMGAKLGLSAWRNDDNDLVHDLLKLMSAAGADFTNVFRDLSERPRDATAAAHHFSDKEAFSSWWQRWQVRLDDTATSETRLHDILCGANPAFIPRNHRIEQVIARAYRGDLRLFEELITVLHDPFSGLPEHRDYRNPPKPEEVVRQTFCGT